MNEKINAALSELFCIFSDLSRSYGTILTICCILIVLDLATGLAKAKIQGEINSSIGYKGFWRKTARLFTAGQQQIATYTRRSDDHAYRNIFSIKQRRTRR